MKFIMKTLVVILTCVFTATRGLSEGSNQFPANANVVFVLTYLKGQIMPTKIESLALSVAEDEKLDAIMEVGYERSGPATFDGQRELYMSYKKDNQWLYYSVAEAEKDFIITFDNGTSRKIKWDDYIASIKIIQTKKQ